MAASLAPENVRPLTAKIAVNEGVSVVNIEDLTGTVGVDGQRAGTRPWMSTLPIIAISPRVKSMVPCRPGAKVTGESTPANWTMAMASRSDKLAGRRIAVEVVGQGVDHRLRSRGDRDGVRVAVGSREVAGRNGERICSDRGGRAAQYSTGRQAQPVGECPGRNGKGERPPGRLVAILCGDEVWL